VGSKAPQRYVASCITTLGGSVDSCFGLLGGGRGRFRRTEMTRPGCRGAIHLL
jgi:hypothetical protein